MATRRYARTLTLLIILAPLALAVHAGPVQSRVCRAALGLGQASARMAYLEVFFQGGTPYQTQLAAVAGNVANAAAEIRAAEAEMPAVYQTTGRREAVRMILADLDRFDPGQYRPEHGQNRLWNIAQRYRQTLSVTINTARVDTRRSEGTCSSYMLNACFHYGYATIASAVRAQDPGGYSWALGGMRQAIDAGLSIAMDGPQQWDNRYKQCCAFGTEAAWAPIRRINNTTPYSTFANLEGHLRQLAFEAELPPGACSGGPPPDDDPPDRTVPCNEVAEQGGDQPERVTVRVGSARSVTFWYETWTKKDRMLVRYNGLVVHDTGCVGEKRTVRLDLSGFDDELSVEVIPNCAGESDTKWEFRVDCPGMGH
ncbi:MAG: hypothetical protein GVY18_09820 [Bacteroidetes bacterium]|jgi:hypothetical protein|nr:hypothetical protein [Bacteroidota bacterium]